jgi:hypothetical protein
LLDKPTLQTTRVRELFLPDARISVIKALASLFFQDANPPVTVMLPVAYFFRGRCSFHGFRGSAIAAFAGHHSSVEGRRNLTVAELSAFTSTTNERGTLQEGIRARSRLFHFPRTTWMLKCGVLSTPTGGRFFCKDLCRDVEMRHVRTSLLQSRENVSDSGTNKRNTTIKSITMKYALLVHLNKEVVDQFKDENAKATAAAAGRAYGEALRAAGIFVAGAGLGPPETATMR